MKNGNIALQMGLFSKALMYALIHIDHSHRNHNATNARALAMTRTNAGSHLRVDCVLENTTQKTISAASARPMGSVYIWLQNALIVMETILQTTQHANHFKRYVYDVEIRTAQLE